jgi:hypothetical protein
MANSNSANGLQAVYNSALGPTKITPYYVSNAQAALAIGTPVTLSGTANSNNIVSGGQEWPAGTLPGIQLATGGDTNKLLGSIVGINFNPTNQLIPSASGASVSASYVPANTEAVVFVADSPDQEFIILDDGANALAVTNIGQNLNLTIGTINTFTGQDSTTLTSASPNTTSTFQVKLLRLNNRPNNVIGLVNAEYVVRINNHLFGNVTAGV